MVVVVTAALLVVYTVVVWYPAEGVITFTVPEEDWYALATVVVVTAAVEVV